MLAKLELYLPQSHKDFVHFSDDEVVTNTGTYKILDIDADEYEEWMDDNCQQQWQQNLSVRIEADVEIISFEQSGTVMRDLANNLMFDTLLVTDVEESLNDPDLNKYYEFLEENNGELIHQLASSLDLAKVA